MRVNQHRIMLGVAFLIAVAPGFLYWVARRGQELSLANADWAQFATFVGIAAAPINLIVLWVLFRTLEHGQIVAEEQYDRAENNATLALVRELHSTIQRYLDFECPVKHRSNTCNWPIRGHLGYLLNHRESVSPGNVVFEETLLVIDDAMQRMDELLATLEIQSGFPRGQIRDFYQADYRQYRRKIEALAYDHRERRRFVLGESEHQVSEPPPAPT